MFGDNIDDTYRKAWQKVLNPPSLNIYIPSNNNKNVNKEYISVNNKHASKEYSLVKENLTQLHPNDLNTELTYSAFSMGTDLYNVDINKVTTFEYKKDLIIKDESKKEVLRNMYNEQLDIFPTINPAEHFDSLMYGFSYKKYKVVLNNHKDISQNPKKEILINAMKNSSIFYIATHGSNKGLWIQDLMLDKEGYPIVIFVNNGGRLEFKPIEGKEENLIKLHFSDIKNIGNKLKWIIMAGCSQLNRIEDGDPTKGWADVLLRNNTVHGVLGYYSAAPGYAKQNDVLNEFFALLKGGVSFINAWKNANEAALPFPVSTPNKRWAVIYNEKNKDDTIMKLTEDDVQKSISKKIYYWRYELDKPCEF